MIKPASKVLYYSTGVVAIGITAFSLFQRNRYIFPAVVRASAMVYSALFTVDNLDNMMEFDGHLTLTCASTCATIIAMNHYFNTRKFVPSMHVVVVSGSFTLYQIVQARSKYREKCSSMAEQILSRRDN